MGELLHDPATILFVSLIVVVGSIVFLRIGAFLSLLAGALTVSFWSAAIGDEPFNPVNSVVNICEALGTTTGKIGVLIVFGTIVGKCMTDSGAADRIVSSCCRLLGEKKTPVALAGSAFLLSIPVFYDATFYLLLPLAKSVYRSFRRNYVLYLLSVGLAATISHTVIPPTPGPIAVADAFRLPLSTSLGIGLLVGICLLPFVLILSWGLNRILPQPKISSDVLAEMRLEPLDDCCESDDLATQNDGKSVFASIKDKSATPPLWLALTPIVLPVVLIACSSVVSAVWGPDATHNGGWRLLITFLGNSNVALGTAAIFATFPLFFSKRRVTRSQFEEKLNMAIVGAGTIILITSAGGAYGEMLRESGIGDRIKALFEVSGNFGGVATLTMAFFSTVLLKSAQGSSTTAMITSAGIFSAMGLTSDDLGFNLGYLAATIGVGSCVASWMNDSGFCVFSRSSGIAEVDCMKVWTVGTGLLGCIGFVITLVLSQLLPLV